MVCVISLEDGDPRPEDVPFNQCREVRAEDGTRAHMDRIIIIASACICSTVIVAVIVFICCNQKRRRPGLKDQLSSGHLTPGPPLASLGTLSTHKEWDQLSMYSQRSIPRARMYHMTDKGEHNTNNTKILMDRLGKIAFF